MIKVSFLSYNIHFCFAAKTSTVLAFSNGLGFCYYGNFLFSVSCPYSFEFSPQPFSSGKDLFKLSMSNFFSTSFLLADVCMISEEFFCASPREIFFVHKE